MHRATLVSSISLTLLFNLLTIDCQSVTEELTELRSRITIFDVIFNNWMTASIATIGVLADYLLGRIPYPNERNSSRLFRYIDSNYDERVDLKEFQSYLVRLFHAHDVVSFEFGRKVSAPEIANHFSISGPDSQNMRWNCLLDYFDEDSDKTIDLQEFQLLKKRRFDAFNCLMCIKYKNHCLDFRELYLTKL